MRLYHLSRVQGSITLQQLDANTEDPIGQKLEVAEALLAAGVDVLVEPQGTFVIEPGLRCRL